MAERKVTGRHRTSHANPHPEGLSKSLPIVASYDTRLWDPDLAPFVGAWDRQRCGPARSATSVLAPQGSSRSTLGGPTPERNEGGGRTTSGARRKRRPDLRSRSARIARHRSQPSPILRPAEFSSLDALGLDIGGRTSSLGGGSGRAGPSTGPAVDVHTSDTSGYQRSDARDPTTGAAKPHRADHHLPMRGAQVPETGPTRPTATDIIGK